MSGVLADGRCGGLSRRSCICYVGGLPWRMLPPCFPPVSTVRRWFYIWRDNGLWQTLNHFLLMATREIHGREASPSAGVIDSQSVKPPTAAVLAAMMRTRRRAAIGIS
jgi:transposase